MASDYQTICQCHGPASYSSRLGGLWMLDEAVGTSGASSVVDSMKTSAMSADGWGTATANHGTPTNVTFGTAFTAGINGQTGATFNGTSSRVAITEGTSFGPMLEYNARFSVYAVCKFDINTILGTQEHAIFARMLDGTTYRGFQFSARYADPETGDATLHVYHINDLGGQRNVCTGSTALPVHTGSGAPDEAWFVAVTYDGAGGYVFYARNLASGGSLAADTTTSTVATLASTADASTSYIGCRTASAAWFKGVIEGVGVEPRTLPLAELQNMYDAARTAASTRVKSKNLGIIKQALQANCLARGIGDSTALSGGTSVTDMLPKRFKTDGTITTRAAHFMSWYGHLSGSVDSTYIDTLVSTEVNGTPAVPWATPVGAKPGVTFVVFPHKAINTPANTEEAYINDDDADPLNDAAFSKVSIRFLYARANSATALATQRFQVTDGTTTQTSADIAITGSDEKMTSTDVALGTVAASGVIKAQLVGGANNESSDQFGGYGALFALSSNLASDVPSGMWWFGSSALSGAVTGQFDDDTLFAMSAITAQDSAFTANIAVSFAYKVVFVQLTINDINGGIAAATVKTQLEAIAARWIALGYRVCFIQPWMCYFANTTSASSRVPVADYESYWEDAFLPIASGSIAVVSIFQRWPGVPFQFLEGPASPAYSIHAVDSHGALRLTIPISQALDEATIDAGTFRAGRSRARPLMGVR